MPRWASTRPGSSSTDVLPRAIKKYGGFDAGGAAQGRARHRHSGGRHDPGLRREVLPARARRWPGRTSARSPVVMQYVDGETRRRLAEQRSRRSDAGDCRCPKATLRALTPCADGGTAAMPMLSVSGLTKKLRRLPGRQRRVLRGRGGRDPRPDRPERLGQEHDLQLHRRACYAPTGGLGPLRRRGDRRPAGEPHLPQGHRPHVPDPAPVPQSDAARERRAGGLSSAQDGAHQRGPNAGGMPRRRWRWSACRPMRAPRPTGSAPPR